MKKLSLVLFMALLPMVAHADDVLDIEPAPKTLKLNIRRMGLELSKPRVTNARQYADQPVSALNL